MMENKVRISVRKASRAILASSAWRRIIGPGHATDTVPWRGRIGGGPEATKPSTPDVDNFVCKPRTRTAKQREYWAMDRLHNDYAEK
jgi:hypothetical protein